MIRRPPPAAGGRRIELHAHTHVSDGVLSPGELVALARERGLVALAITDHDAVEGIAPAREAAGDALEVIPGIEISTADAGADLHILGYFLDPADPTLVARLDAFREERRERVRRILASLAGQGVAIAPEAVFAAAGPGVVGRPHVAALLIEGGHVASVEEAFQRFLSPRGSAYVPRPQFPPADAVALIRGAGGVAVLAHPGTSVSDAVVEQLAATGLSGIEVWHPVHGAAAREHWRRHARRLDLVATGGSDFHGPHRGAGLGEMPVPMRTIELLRARAGAGAGR